LTPSKDLTRDDVKLLIISAVKQLKEKQPDVPILLVDHDGYSDASLNLIRKDIVAQLNKANQEAYAQLMSDGYTELYLLTKDELNLSYESFVDGTHPTDLGMMEYANAYETRIREILNEQAGPMLTMKPVTQMREPYNYDWEGRHRELLELNKSNPPDICFFGNSITHFWGGNPEGPRREGVKSWDKTFEGLKVRNFGFGWDRIENVLWRIYHGELDGFDAKQLVLKIGTNNLHLHTEEEIIGGLELLITSMRNRQPDAEVLIIGLLPRHDNEEKVADLNLAIAQLAGKANVGYADIGKLMLKNDGKIDESLFSDGLHPNSKGYEVIGPELRRYLVK